MSARERIREFYRKIVGEKGTPSFVARGWSIGVFIGCLIPFGCQLVISIPLAFLLKGSRVGATTGTLITNPFTIGFIYPFQCWVGSRLIGSPLVWSDVEVAFARVVENGDWATLLSLAGTYVAAFFAGGLLFAVLLAPAVHFAVLAMVRAYRARRGEETAA